MSGDLLTAEQLLSLVSNGGAMPPKYVNASPANVPGVAGYRLLDAAHISTGIMDPNRLGTGSTGAGNLYLADDGTWKLISGAPGVGDMLKATYDVDNDGIVDSAERIQILVRNSTGSTLTKGTVVYLSGATGNRPNAVKAQANTEATSSKTFGIVVANINNNSDGYVACNGTLHDLDTSAFTAGDALWLSATTAGAYTSTIPVEPNHTVFIGFVARSHPTQGRLVILIQNGYELNELHGVLVASEANNDLLVYETSTTLWKNKSISTIFGGTPLVSVPTLAQVTTAGNTTTNAITVGGLIVDTNTLVVDSVNNRVGIGTVTPNASLHVVGFMSLVGPNSNFLITTGSGASITTAINSLIIGANAGLSVTTGNNNLFIGADSGRSTTDGYDNLFIGTNAGRNNIGGTNTNPASGGPGGYGNTFIGIEAGFSNTNGRTNDFIGYKAGYSNTTGFNNMAIGRNALYLNQTGYQNLIIGNEAGFGVTGNFNIVIGGDALSSGNGSYNVAIGDEAGRRVAAGTNNAGPINNSIFIGRDTRASVANGTNETVIGYQAIGLGSNTSVIGNSSTTFGRWWGNLLIGTSTNAGYKLDVNGTARVQGTTTITPAVDTSALVSTGYSVTGSGTTALIDLSGTWNTTGIPTAIKLNVTDTASNVTSLFLDFQIGGSSRFSVNKNGQVRLSSWLVMGSNTFISYGGIGNISYSRSTQSGTFFTIKNDIASLTTTSGAINEINFGSGFAPTSGTATFTTFLINPTVNQTGGANGITRGLYINPTITAAADFRAIETTAGKIIHQGLGNATTANVVYYNSSTGLLTYGTAPIGAQFVIDYDYNIVGLKNNINTTYNTSQSFLANTTRVYLNGQRLTRGVGYDYVEVGLTQIQVALPPASTDQLIIEYQI